MTTEETRDGAGRLVSVVVDGQRFHRAVGPTWHDGFLRNCDETDAERWRLRDEVERLRTALMVAEEGLGAEIGELAAEVRSLRGVVQAVEALRDKWRQRAQQSGLSVDHQYAADLTAALAAAADAPQPEPTVEIDGVVMPQSHYDAARWPLLNGITPELGDAMSVEFGEAACPLPSCPAFKPVDSVAGPSPAVLPETPETKDQR